MIAPMLTTRLSLIVSVHGDHGYQKANTSLEDKTTIAVHAMSKVFLVDLEAVETRYTGQWKAHVPNLLRKAGHEVHIISGPSDIPSATTPGAFLNFGGTNIYKANQVEQLGRLFCAGSVKAGDHFIFTDAWHPGIINLKYMSELLGIPVVTHGLWRGDSVRFGGGGGIRLAGMTAMMLIISKIWDGGWSVTLCDGVISGGVRQVVRCLFLRLGWIVPRMVEGAGGRCAAEASGIRAWRPVAQGLGVQAGQIAWQQCVVGLG